MLWGAGAGQNASIPPDTHLSIAFMTSYVVCGLCPLKKKGKKKSEELSPKSTHLPKGGIIERSGPPGTHTFKSLKSAKTPNLLVKH